MHSTRCSVFRVTLALLFALSSLVQQQTSARALLPACAGAADCGLESHRLTLPAASVALAASMARLGLHDLSLDHRGITDANMRGGVDLLFRARSDLLVARAQVSQEEYRRAAWMIHAAMLGTASTPSRAPPHIS